jgi:hypothetical protein
VFCNQCGVEVEVDDVGEGEVACQACGHVLPTVDEPLVLITVSDEPAAPTVTTPVTIPTAIPAAIPASDPLPTPVVAPVALYDLAEDEPDLLVTAPQPVTVTPTSELPLVAASPATGFRFGAVSAFAVITLVLATASLPSQVILIATDAIAPTFEIGAWRIADLGTNLPGALMVALVALVVGAVGAAFRQRWAAGLAGGAGLAIAGWAALGWALAERELAFAVAATRRPTAEPFVITLTRDAGYWLMLVAGVLGLLTFLVSLGRAGNDRRRGLNPWIAALGACAALIAAVGPLLPETTADLRDNWIVAASDGRPMEFLVGRLVQLGLLAYAGVVGFLLVRRYGLGLAIGGMTVSVWLAITTLLDVGTNPVGPGITNLGDPAGIDLHSATIVGMVALVGLAVVAVIAAYDQAAREYQG